MQLAAVGIQARRQPPESPVELLDTPARRSHNVAQRRKHDVSSSGHPESNVPTGWMARNAVVPAMLQASSTAWTALLIAWVIASRRSAFCFSEWVSPSTHLRHASLRVSRSNKRPERKIASAWPSWTWADERSFSRPLDATGVLVRASSVTSSRVLRATPSIGVGIPVAAAPTSGSRYSGPSIVGSGLEFRHHRKGPELGHIDVGHRDVIAARAPHPHGVPRVDDFALFAPKIDHHLGIVPPDPSSSTKAVDAIQSAS